MKKIIALIMTLLMGISLCACGGSNTQEATTEAAAKTDFTGVYTAYAAEVEGQCVKTAGILESILTLKEDGKATLTFNEESRDLTYKIDGEKISFDGDEEVIEGTIKEGIVKVNDPDYVIYYVAEGADTSSIPALELTDIAGGDSEATTEAAAGTGSAKHYVVSDDTHFVIDIAGVLLSYEHDGDKVTGLKGYVDAGNETVADAVIAEYQKDESITKVEQDGTWIIITYDASKYESYTLKTLETAFADKKVTK